jgi:bifunctional DNase/RNase
VGQPPTVIAVAAPTVELRVIDVRPAVPAGAGVEAGLVVLQETDPPGRMLRMFIGQPEARAIQISWQGTVPPRPSTWDLFVSTIEILGGRLHEAVITAVAEERHFFAAMELIQGDVSRTVACRPSDALALALRSPGARILTNEDVMEAAGVLADGSKPGRVEHPAPEPAPSGVPASGVPEEKTSVKKAPAARKAVAKKVAAKKVAAKKVAAPAVPAGPVTPPPRRAAAVRKALPPPPPRDQSGT